MLITHRMFYNIFYEDTDHQTFDAREYENKIVKVIVRKKSNSKKFEKFIDKLYSVGVADLKTVENFEVGDPEEFEAFESEDTLSILNTDISKKQKSVLINLFCKTLCEQRIRRRVS